MGIRICSCIFRILLKFKAFTHPQPHGQWRYQACICATGRGDATRAICQPQLQLSYLGVHVRTRHGSQYRLLSISTYNPPAGRLAAGTISIGMNMYINVSVARVSIRVAGVVLKHATGLAGCEPGSRRIATDEKSMSQIQKPWSGSCKNQTPSTTLLAAARVRARDNPRPCRPVHP
jgi:hypothetical protein